MNLPTSFHLLISILVYFLIQINSRLLSLYKNFMNFFSFNRVSTSTSAPSTVVFCLSGEPLWHSAVTSASWRQPPRETFRTSKVTWRRRLAACSPLVSTWTPIWGMLIPSLRWVEKCQCKIAIIFLSISLSMCFGCLKEPSHWDGSYEYPQHMFWLRNKKINFSYALLSGGLWSAKQLTRAGIFWVFSGAEIRPHSQWYLGDFFPNFEKKIPNLKKK